MSYSTKGQAGMESLSKLPKVTETMKDSNLNNLPPGRMGS